MASVNAALSIKLLDANKVPKSLLVPFVCSSGLLADMQAFATAYLGDLDAVTASQITTVDIEINQPTSGLKSAPVAGTNNQTGALYDFRDVLSEQFGMYIPNWIVGGFDPLHENLVDQTNLLVIAFQNRMLTATSNCTPTGEDWQGLAAVFRAVKTNRKQRKALNRAR